MGHKSNAVSLKETEEMKTYRRESDIKTKVKTAVMWHKQGSQGLLGAIRG